MADRSGRCARTLSAGLLVALLVGLPLPQPAPAQTAPASLVADDVTYDAETERLTASGEVEVLYEGRVLRARRIVYDTRSEEIRVTGPMTLTDPGGVVFLADAAALSPDLREGLIEGARLLIDGQLQIAAAELRRTDGRFNTLYNTVASACVVCAENPTPTWAVRAARITQDEENRRIYFENATVELLGVPVAYAPRLSFPDPRVDRASGVLLPTVQQSDIYGLGVKVPYYRVLGRSGDITVTPFVTTGGAVIVEGEYRRRLRRGGFDLRGAFAIDDGLNDDGAGRGWFSAVGDYRLPRDFVLGFDVNVASDDSFLQQFDYSDTDLLTSVIAVQRTRRNAFLNVEGIRFQSLRDDEDTNTVPFVLPYATYRRVMDTSTFGRFGYNVDALGISREVGRDVFRAGGGVDWHHDWTAPNGMLLAATAATEFDAYQVWRQPGESEGARARAVPIVSAELRWPFARTTGRAQHVIEPAAQVVYSRYVGDENVPNEDSQLPEFDTTNLFSLNRFPGRDRWETGLRANVGVSYTRYDPAGWSAGATLGRVLRTQELDDFSEGTGLRGPHSDWVGAVSVDFDWGLTVANRALFDDSLAFRRNELAFGYDGPFGAVSAAYVFLEEDDGNPALGEQPQTNEFSLEAAYRVHPNWEIRGLWRYDLTSDSNLRTGAGVTYGNECAEFDLSVSRRFTSSNNVPPSTSIRFGLRLAGIGDGEARDWPARVCLTRGT